MAAEGVSTAEAAREIAKHAERHRHHDRLVSVIEAVLLSIVTLVAAWSGFAAAKWDTESRLKFAEANSLRTKANRAHGEAVTFRAVDASMFNTWFTAYVAGDENAANVAKRRFRPVERAAFDAWMATDPFTNTAAPAGPQAMPQYRPAGEAEASALDAKADAAYTDAEHGGKNSDNYVRTTVVLASVLFLVGLSTQFPYRAIRLGLIGLGVALLTVAVATIVQLPTPP
jgi:hypothetical protein